MQRTITTKFVNGHKYVLLTLPNTDFFQFEVINNLGANVERAANVSSEFQSNNIFGLAHLVEHLSFRAPKDYTTMKLVHTLATEGAYNASTNMDRINYWFRSTSDRAQLAVNLVCNYAFNDLINIPEDEFQVEKKVVYNEAKRYLDDDQTIFSFSVEPIVCGYNHVEDNILGLPAVIDTFTLQDAITLKDLFLNEGEHTLNVTYDPTAMTEDDVINMIETELERFPISGNSYKRVMKLHDEMWYQPVDGEYVVDNESEQAMTALLFNDVIGGDINSLTARFANTYLSTYSDTSLTKLIREENGLTYGVQFYDDITRRKPYVHFGCDVTRGNEQLLMDLFKESIVKSVNAYNEEEHDKVKRIRELKRKMAFVDQKQYLSMLWNLFYDSESLKQFAKSMEHSLDDTHAEFDRVFGNYERMREYMERLLNKVESGAFCRVTNLK